MQETIIGNYKILEEIGRGGMGIVYLGEQVSLKRQVAIKTLPLEMAHDDEYLQRIENEAKILAKFSNPNIVYIHDRVRHEDAIYLIMEYVPGITVTDHLRDHGPYELNEAARIIIRVAVALEHAHSKGIIHRDIKPSNIMIRRNNVVKVTDFGIAKSSEGSDITRVRFTPGTQNYMSPEQARGMRDIDGRSDIYSLGVVFYQMVTGKIPPYPVPSRLPVVPPRYERIILKCLAEDPSERYQTAKELVAALDEAKEAAKRPKKSKTTDGPPKKKTPLLIMASVVVLVVALSIWQFNSIHRYFDTAPETQQPETQPTVSEQTAKQTDIVIQEVPPPSEDELSGVDTIETFEIEAVDDSNASEPYNETYTPPIPVLRPAADRTREIAMALSNRQDYGLQNNPRTIFALKTGFIEAAGTNSDVAFTVKALFDQMEVVSRVDQGGCDLLVVMDPNSQNVMLSSNLYGDDRIDKYQESFYYQDDQQLFTKLEIFIQKYYCFNILGSMNLLRTMDDGFTAEIALKGESSGMIKVGSSISVCLNSSRDAYSILLSVNSEGIFMLFPQIREEHVPFSFQKPFCTGPMEVSPPTGSEMIAAIVFVNKSLLPIDGYLAPEDQVLIEPASWSYDLYASNNAIEYCESLFTMLSSALSDQYSVDSKYIKTSN